MFFIEIFDDLIKDGHHFKGEVDELMVEFPVELLEVLAMDHEHMRLIQVHFIELGDVDLFGEVFAIDW